MSAGAITRSQHLSDADSTAGDSQCGFRRITTPRQGTDGTSHEVPVPFGDTSPVIVDAPAYLTGTFRSQGFAPSQRFDPTVASWLYFAPLPPIGSPWF